MSESLNPRDRNHFLHAAAIAQGNLGILQAGERKTAIELRSANFTDAVIPALPFSPNAVLPLAARLGAALRGATEFSTFGTKLVPAMFQGRAIVGFTQGTDPVVRKAKVGGVPVITVPVRMTTGGLESALPIRKAARAVIKAYKDLSK